MERKMMPMPSAAASANAALPIQMRRDCCRPNGQQTLRTKRRERQLVLIGKCRSGHGTPPLYTPRSGSAASRPMIANAAHSGSLVTMLFSVVWFDSSKGFGFAGPIEPGHPDVKISEKELHAAGVFYPEPRTLLMLTFNPSAYTVMLTFNPSEYTVRRRPKALVVRLP